MVIWSDHLIRLDTDKFEELVRYSNVNAEGLDKPLGKNHEKPRLSASGQGSEGIFQHFFRPCLGLDKTVRKKEVLFTNVSLIYGQWPGKDMRIIPPFNLQARSIASFPNYLWDIPRNEGLNHRDSLTGTLWDAPPVDWCRQLSVYHHLWDSPPCKARGYESKSWHRSHQNSFHLWCHWSIDGPLGGIIHHTIHTRIRSPFRLLKLSIAPDIWGSKV